MTTTPLPPPAYPESAKHGASKNGKHVKVVIRPALYTAEQMQAYATKARADLEAEVQRLREALKRIESMCAAPPDFSDATIQDVARAALENRA